MARRPLIAGNWKMYAPKAPEAFIDGLAAAAPAGNTPNGAGILICPPNPFIGALRGRGIRIGAQDCHRETEGAYTGEVSAEMLARVGATHVIVGHSERRADHHETNDVVAGKVKAVWRHGMTAIVCVGEDLSARERGGAVVTVLAQLYASLPTGATAVNTVIAYEPIWAIGSGRTPKVEEIAVMHRRLREDLKKRFGPETAGEMRILYGGSVKPENAEAILALDDVDGALVGGASLDVRDLLAIANAAP